jgi:hypothetical protein
MISASSAISPPVRVKIEYGGIVGSVPCGRQGRRRRQHLLKVCRKCQRPYHWYDVDPITEANLHERRYPGVTHILRKDCETHAIQVIMLADIVKRIEAGLIRLPTQTIAGR